MADADVVIVGGGHNGLVAGAYLARGGMKVLVLEARDTTGGCASTVEAVGARVNICNCDHVMVRSTPIAEELGLAEHGLRYLDLEPHSLNLTWEGKPGWFAFHDLERTLDSIAVSYPSQVDGYRRWIADATPVVELIREATTIVPTPGKLVGTVLGRRLRGVRTMLAWSRMSAESVMRRYFTEEAIIAPVLATAPTVWGLPPDFPGTGLAALNFAMRHRTQPGRPVGGSGAFPAAVESALRAAGGDVRCGAPVDRILVESNRVRGVRLESGEVIEARVVIGAVDPHLVFVEWLDGQAPETAKWRKMHTHEGYESKIDAVVSELPAFLGVDHQRHGVVEPLIPTMMVAPSLAGMKENHRLAKQGRIAERPVFYTNYPSVLDPSMKPIDGHIFSLEALFTPYSLQGGWDGSGEPERWLSTVASLMEPGFLDTIRRWRLVGPRDYESDFGMRNGYAPSFAGGPLAALRGADPELTRYRTSVAGLYLTGAATFPGAGVWGASGRNTASVVLADRA